MKSFIKKIVIINIVLIGFIGSWGHFCDWFFANPEFLDHTSNKRAWSIKQRNEEYDFAVLGSSRAFGSFNMMQLSELTKKEGINISANGSGYVDNYLILYLFLKNNNKIKTLFLQVDIYSLNSKQSFSNAFHTYEFLPYWSDPTIKEGLQPFIDKKELFIWTYFSSFRYFNYNKYFSPKEVIRRFGVRSADSPFDKTFGGPYDDGKDTYEQQDNFIITSNHNRDFDLLDVKYLSKIIKLCNQNQINIIAYKAPELVMQQKAILNYMDLNKQIDSLLSHDHIPYLTTYVMIENDVSNFSDPTHLSMKGRELFTRTFSEKCKECF